MLVVSLEACSVSLAHLLTTFRGDEHTSLRFIGFFGVDVQYQRDGARFSNAGNGDCQGSGDDTIYVRVELFLGEFPCLTS